MCRSTKECKSRASEPDSHCTFFKSVQRRPVHLKEPSTGIKQKSLKLVLGSRSPAALVVRFYNIELLMELRGTIYDRDFWFA